MDFSGKTAVITGASRGIGAQIARKFASLGADVVIVYAGNTEAADAVAAECKEEYNVKAECFKCDVSDFEETKALAAQIKKEFGTVNILVNNAGITKDGLIAMMKEEDFDAVIGTNLKGTFNMIRNFVSFFIRNRGGAIINISSVAGIMGNAGQANYSASKAGIIGLTKTVAKELAPRGVTCNAIAPGFVETDMTKAMNADMDAICKMIPLGRLAKPEDIADAAAFLASADYITGEVLKVDGGIAM